MKMAENILCEEIEVLEAIYIHELQVARNEHDEVVRVEILLHPSTGDDVDQQFYPTVPPDITIKNPRGIAEEEVQSLREDMHTMCLDKCGGPMLYELIELAKESLTAGNIPHCSCMICLEHFTEGESFTKTDCYHYFHMTCFARYVEHSLKQETEVRLAHHKEKEEKKVLCPVCRDKITFEKNSLPESPVEGHFLFTPSAEMVALQKKMATMLERQRAKGGIIDVEAEKNKFLLREDELVYLPVPKKDDVPKIDPTNARPGKGNNSGYDRRNRNNRSPRNRSPRARYDNSARNENKVRDHERRNKNRPNLSGFGSGKGKDDDFDDGLSFYNKQTNQSDGVSKRKDDYDRRKTEQRKQRDETAKGDVRSSQNNKDVVEGSKTLSNENVKKGCDEKKIDRIIKTEDDEKSTSSKSDEKDKEETHKTQKADVSDDSKYSKNGHWKPKQHRDKPDRQFERQQGEPMKDVRDGKDNTRSLNDNQKESNQNSVQTNEKSSPRTTENAECNSKTDQPDDRKKKEVKYQRNGFGVPPSRTNKEGTGHRRYKDSYDERPSSESAKRNEKDKYRPRKTDLMLENKRNNNFNHHRNSIPLDRQTKEAKEFDVTKQKDNLEIRTCKDSKSDMVSIDDKHNNNHVTVVNNSKTDETKEKVDKSAKDEKFPPRLASARGRGRGRGQRRNGCDSDSENWRQSSASKGTSNGPARFGKGDTKRGVEHVQKEFNRLNIEKNGAESRSKENELNCVKVTKVQSIKASPPGFNLVPPPGFDGNEKNSNAVKPPPGFK